MPVSSPSRPDRVLWPDLLRLVAILCVILLHVSAPFLHKAPYASRNWWITNLFDSGTRVGVPLFFMLSGTLLLDRAEALRVLFRHQIFRLVWPLVFWSAFYVIRRDPEHWTGLWDLGLIGFGQRLLSGAVEFHLWFLYAMIGIYLVLPFLRQMVRHGPRVELWYFVGLWILFASILPLLRDRLELKVFLPVEMATGLFGYPVLGWLLGNQPSSRKMLVAGPLLYLLGAGLTAYGIYHMTDPHGKVNEYAFGNAQPNVLLASVGAFVTLRALGETWAKWRRPWSTSAIHAMSQCTFGIYLVHALMLDASHILHVHLRAHGLVFPLGPTLLLRASEVFVASFCLVWIMRKIPWVRTVVP